MGAATTAALRTRAAIELWPDHRPHTRRRSGERRAFPTRGAFSAAGLWDFGRRFFCGAFRDEDGRLGSRVDALRRGAGVGVRACGRAEPIRVSGISGISRTRNAAGPLRHGPPFVRLDPKSRVWDAGAIVRRARRLESPEERRRPEDGEDERFRPRDVGGGVGVAFPRERRRRSGRAPVGRRRKKRKKRRAARKRPRGASRRRAGVPARDGQTEAGFVLDFTRSGARAFARSDRTRAGFETGRRVGGTNRREVRARLVSGARRLPGPGNRGRGTAPSGVSSQSSLSELALEWRFVARAPARRGRRLGARRLRRVVRGDARGNPGGGQRRKVNDRRDRDDRNRNALDVSVSSSGDDDDVHDVLRVDPGFGVRPDAPRRAAARARGGGVGDARERARGVPSGPSRRVCRRGKGESKVKGERRRRVRGEPAKPLRGDGVRERDRPGRLARVLPHARPLARVRSTRRVQDKRRTNRFDDARPGGRALRPGGPPAGRRARAGDGGGAGRHGVSARALRRAPRGARARLLRSRRAGHAAREAERARERSLAWIPVVWIPVVWIPVARRRRRRERRVDVLEPVSGLRRRGDFFFTGPQ